MFLFPLYLYAIEGNEPEAKLELISPKIKQKELDTTKIIIPEHLFETYINSKYGNTEYGKEYGLNLGRKEINKSFELRAEKIENKNLIGGNIGINNIEDNNLTEFHTKAFGYSINNEWYENCIFDLNGENFMGNNIFKTSGSLLYENEVLWDAMVLFGRNIKGKIFIGAGVSVPYNTPAIQINWNVNDKLVINSLYRSKQVINTLEDMYVTQRNLKINPELENENYNATAEINFLYGNKMGIGVKYNQIKNGIGFIQMQDFLEPVNITENGRSFLYGELSGNKLNINKWNLNFNFNILGLKDTLSFEYLPTESDYYLPKVSGKNILAISIPYGIGLGIENEYIGEKYIHKYNLWEEEVSPGRDTLQDYWLHNIVIAKEFKNITVWGKISNLTNTKYEIIKGVDGYGTSIEAGIKLSI